MKKTLQAFIIMAALLVGVRSTFAQAQGHVDERFELTGIAFRLTDDIAFVHSNPECYMADIDSCFGKFKNHEFIEFLKKTMYSKSVLSIAMPADFAMDIKITPKGIVWTDEWKTYCDLTDTMPDNLVWTKKEMAEYLRLLNKFYKDTDFHNFYLKHRSFYDQIESCFNATIAPKIDTSWFSSFFGMPYKLDHLCIVPVFGKDNFGRQHSDKKGKTYNTCVISCVSIDTNGQVYFQDGVQSTLIHEVCHNYCNPICARYQDLFKDVCDTLFTFVGEHLAKAYYGEPTSILYEGLNRLCELSYYKSTGTLNDSILYHRIQGNVMAGFFWMKDMLRYMDIFFNNRDVFKTFEDFIPSLEQFLESCTGLMDSYYIPKYNQLRPRVVATYPGNHTIVDTNLKALVFQFSKPMQISAQNIWVLHDEGLSMIPFDKNPYWLNEYFYVVPLTESLKPHSKYGFRITDFLADAIDFCPCIPYDLYFETK